MPTNPTAGDVHVSQPLTNFSQFWLQNADRFVSMEGMSVVPVDKQFDEYYEWNREDLLRDEAQRRADGTPAQRMQLRVATGNYAADVIALRTQVTDRQRANADSQLRLEQSKTAALMQKMMIQREGDFQQSFMGTGIWAGAPDLTPTDKWPTAAGRPIQEIRSRMTAILGRTGMMANRIIFGKQAWDSFVDSDDALGRVLGGSMTSQPAVVQRSLIAALFEVERVDVMSSVVNTAVLGEAESTGFLPSSDDVLIYHAPSGSPGLDTPTAGVSFNWTGFTGASASGARIRRYRDEDIQSDWIEAEMAYDHKVTAPELGAYITSVSS